MQDLLLVEATKSTLTSDVSDEIPEEMAPQNNFLNFFESLKYIEKMMINTTHYLEGDSKTHAQLILNGLQAIMLEIMLKQ